jgi:LysM repeat protein
MNRFETISPQKNTLSKKSESEHHKMTRRTFLKTSAAVTAAVAINEATKHIPNSAQESKYITKKNDAYDYLAQKRKTAPSEVQEIRELYAKPTQRQEKITQQDQKSIGKTFSQQLETQNSITINKETRKAIYQYWIEKYRNDKINYENGIVAGLERMKPWASDMKQKFKDYEIPEDYIYLAIAESHFDMDATSGKGATGPFQIMPQTARNYNLTVTENYDERRDPVKSAELCAKHIHDSYKQFGGKPKEKTQTDKDRKKNTEAMLLALMAYNGGYVNKYSKFLNEQDQKARPKIQSIHVVKKGDSLYKIAQQYNTSIVLLRRTNFGKKTLTKKETKKLKVGQTILIPQERTPVTLAGFNTWLEEKINDEIKEKIQPITEDRKRSASEIKKIVNIIGSYHENINYPDKFFAIKDIIKEDKLSKILKVKKPYREINPPKTNVTHFEHKVQKGDTLSKIAKKIKKQYPKCPQQTFVLQIMLMRANGSTHKIKIGQKITLDFPLKRPATLKDVAKKYKTDLEKIKELNPAFKDETITVAKDKQIRIPT